MATAGTSRVFRFGPFQLDPAQHRLCREGVPLRVAASRLRLLHLFVSRPGDLVTREEIATFLWDKSGTVDPISGINTAVNQLRGVLDDDSAHPTYIQTVIGTGYRFIAPVIAEEKAEKATLALAEHPVTPPALALPEAPAARPLADQPAGSRKRKWFPMLFSGGLALALLVLLVLSRRAVSHPTAAGFRSLQLTRVTGDGDLEFADISPDGRYVAYVRDEETGHSLWLKELTTGNVIELARMGKDECPGLAFAPDGRAVYFLRKAALATAGDLERISLQGGSAVRVLSEVSGAPAISPDGKNVAFVRSTLITHGEDSIVVAALDGSGERVLRTYEAPGVHWNRISWTADGQSLVYPGPAGLMLLRADGSTERIVLGPSWGTVNDVQHLGTGGNFVIAADTPGQPYAQLLQVSGNAGPPRAITHDLADYRTVRATGDGQALLTLQDLVLSSLEIVDPRHTSGPHRLTGENQDHDGVDGLTWSEDGDLFFSSAADPHQKLRVVRLSGHAAPAVSLTIPGSIVSDPVVSTRGGFLALVQWQDADVAHVWRANLDGTGARALTSGRQDLSPAITPDGQWIVYESVEHDRSVLKKISSQGGPPVTLTDYDAGAPAISPDGRWIACSYTPSPGEQPRLAIVPLNGGRPARVFPLPEAVDPRPAWTPDGSSVTFLNRAEGVDNVWRQPVSGGAPSMVTHFTSGRIFRFAWSRDGHIALARGTETIDAVVVRNFAAAQD